ncbi:hypothetical protein NDU88_002174 [Pleurodeles waltl]|uniref:Uncharacterized protein n=1 Tax=Pleurodeles waltl TaxID=8319 RepID=A0AAV7TK17_PLEWA|nr:hypothetical protein NDU88_002174 [Pleurodeles waltl]
MRVCASSKSYFYADDSAMLPTRALIVISMHAPNVLNMPNSCVLPCTARHQSCNKSLTVRACLAPVAILSKKRTFKQQGVFLGDVKALGYVYVKYTIVI